MNEKEQIEREFRESRPYRTEQILLVDPHHEDLSSAGSSLSKFFPSADVKTAADILEFQKSISESEFDIVVLDTDLSHEVSMIELMTQLKTEDYEPSVVIISRNPDPNHLNELYKSGCHRCIVKDGKWVEELGAAVDYLIRWRKAERENLLLRAKLTEANMLLQEKNKRLDEFSATVAHDIRGPLASVAMRLDFILDSYRDKIDEKLRILLERALQSTERLTDLVQAMYEYAKLGSKANRFEPVELGKLIEQVLMDMPFEESLDIQVELGEMPVVWGNADLLRGVFINLINNAVKYNDKASIKLKFQYEGIKQRVLAPFALISIEDNGSGMSAEDLEHIFSMFVRGNRAEDFSAGTGVGLAVVKRVIELHFGEISVKSEPGQGTTFLLSLPLEKLDL